MDVTCKERIIEAAVLELREHGASFRMDDLAKRLNISKRTLYENFTSKNAIVEQIVKERANNFYEQHRAIFSNPKGSCEETLKAFFSVRSTLFTSLNGGHFRNMYSSMPELIEDVLNVYEKSWQLVREYLEEQKRLGQIRDINIDSFIMLLQGCLRYYFYAKPRDSHDDILEALPGILDILCYGILNKGEK